MARSQVINAPRLRQKLIALQDDVIPSAVARAVNRVAGTVRTRSSRSIAKAAGLKVGPVRRRVVISKKATKVDPTAAVKITGKPLNLIEFKPNPKTPEESQAKRRGVRTSAWGKRQRHNEAFIARMPNGSVIVVKRSRAGKAGKKIGKGPWAGKSPHIEAMFGPGIAGTAAETRLRIEREVTIKERMPIEMQRELRFRVSKLLVK